MAKPIEVTPHLSKEETVYFLQNFLKSSTPPKQGQRIDFKAIHENILKKAAQGEKKHF